MSEPRPSAINRAAFEKYRIYPGHVGLCAKTGGDCVGYDNCDKVEDSRSDLCCKYLRQDRRLNCRCVIDDNS